MNRAALTFLALCLTSAAAAAAEKEEVLNVTLDQATVTTIPTNTSTVIIGNPAIADVTTLKNGIGMVVTGKGYGHTNLVLLDNAGNVLDKRQVHVDPPQNLVVVQRGNSRESLSCHPDCMPSAVLGDDTKVFNDVSGQVTAHDQLAGRGGQH